MRLFSALLMAGVLLSIVGTSVDGLRWLTPLGLVTFLGAVAYAALSSLPHERQVVRESVSADVTVTAQRLPGVGWRYSVPADRNRHVMIVLEDAGSRHLVLVDPSLDEPVSTVRLSADDAGVVAALLTGARFDIDVCKDEVPRRAQEKVVVAA